MTPQQRLVNLMQTKATICSKLMPNIKYFYKADKEELLALPNSIANTAITNMINNINNNYSLSKKICLGATICPFCTINTYLNNSSILCDLCGYGKRHGICSAHKRHPKNGLNTWVRLVEDYNSSDFRLTADEILAILNGS